MSLLSYILITLLSLSGILFGIILQKKAPEEKEPSKKFIRIMKIVMIIILFVLIIISIVSWKEVFILYIAPTIFILTMLIGTQLRLKR